MYVPINSDFSSVFAQATWTGSISRCERRYCPAGTHARGKGKRNCRAPSLPLALCHYSSTQICFKPVMVRDLCPEYDQLNLSLLQMSFFVWPHSFSRRSHSLGDGTLCSLWNIEMPSLGSLTLCPFAMGEYSLFVPSEMSRDPVLL